MGRVLREAERNQSGVGPPFLGKNIHRNRIRACSLLVRSTCLTGQETWQQKRSVRMYADKAIAKSAGRQSCNSNTGFKWSRAVRREACIASCRGARRNGSSSRSVASSRVCPVPTYCCSWPLLKCTTNPATVCHALKEIRGSRGRQHLSRDSRD